MLKWLRNYFGFSKSETYGTIIIFIIMALMIASPFYLEHILEKEITVEYLALLDSVEVAEEPKLTEVEKKDSLFNFDPNSAALEELITLGLSEKIAARILNFRNKGGEFENAEDLKMIYGIDSLWVSRVEKFVKIKPKTEPIAAQKFQQQPKKEVSEKEISAPVLVDINVADTTELKAIRGIGSKLSARIVKFRDGLGGFFTLDQLKEVYGLSEEIIQTLKTRFYVSDSFVPDKFEINSCTKEELATHPYLSKKTVELIINYRTNHFPLQPSDLEKIPTLDSTQINRILQYLNFNH